MTRRQPGGIAQRIQLLHAFNVVSTHIALNPSNRSAYVDGPDSGVTEISLSPE
jgi:hypothetical protein